MEAERSAAAATCSLCGLEAELTTSGICAACHVAGRRADAYDEQPATHVHEWGPVGMTTERRLVSDGRRDWYVSISLAVRSCKCGAIRKTEVARV